MTTKEIKENLTLAQNLLEQWLKVKQFFLLGISTVEITEDDEAEYLATTSAIAQNIRKLGQRIDERRYPFRKEEISSLLKTCVSVQQFRTMPLQDQKKFEADWHCTMVFLSRTVGAFKFLEDGYRLPKSRSKKVGSKQNKSNTKLFAGIVGGVIAVVVALWFLGFIG